MNKAEVGQLLAFASGFDRFIEVGPLNVAAWHTLPVVQRMTYTEAQQAAADFYTTWDGRTQLSPARITASARSDADIAADVRSARARKLIGSEWPEGTPLPDDVQAKVDKLRAEQKEFYRLNPWAIA